MRRSRWKHSRRRTQPSSRRGPRSFRPRRWPICVRSCSATPSMRCATTPTGHGASIRRRRFRNHRRRHCRAASSASALGRLTRCRVIERLQRGAAEFAELLVWQRALAAMANVAIDLAHIGHGRPARPRAALRFLAARASPTLPPGLLVRRFEIDDAVYALAVGTENELQSVDATSRRAQRPGVSDARVAAIRPAGELRVARFACPRARARSSRTHHAVGSARRPARSRRRARRCRAPAMGDRERPCARVGPAVLLDYGLDQRAFRRPSRAGAGALGRTRDPALSARAARDHLAVDTGQSRLGAAVRGLQPRARDARAQRGRSDDARSRSSCR